MTDAGYRWAYCQLEHPGMVSRASRVSVRDVLAAQAYWGGPEVDESAWLRDDILPTVRTFLQTHAEHNIVYGDYEKVTDGQPKAFLSWLEVGSGASPTPRWFAHVLRLRTWTQAVAWVRANRAPWWWSDEELKDVARVRFEEIVNRGAG
jgi:hypothetical protein